MSTSMSSEEKSVAGLMGELPYLSSPHEGYLNGEVCYNCFQTDAPNDVICSACKQMYYCSTTCQQEDWTYGPHERECGVYSCLSEELMEELKQDGTSSVQTDVRMVGRMLVKRQRNFEPPESWTKGFPQGYVRRRVGDLLTHVQNIPSGWVDDKWALFNKTYAINDEVFKNVTYNQFKAYIGLISINSFGICRSNMYADDYSIGKGLYLQFSRFNHSCGDPDFSYFCIGRVLIMRPLKPNMQITKDTLDNFLIDYGTTGQCGYSKDRLQKLKGGYFFRCQCQMCLDESGDRTKRRAVNKACSHCRKPLIARKSKMNQLKSAHFYCMYCKKESGAIPYSHYKRYRQLLNTVVSMVDSDDSTMEQVNNVLTEAESLPLRLDDKSNLPLYQLRQSFCRKVCKEAEEQQLSEETLDRLLQMIDTVLKATAHYKFTGIRWNSILAAKVAAVFQQQGRPPAALQLYKASRDLWISTTTPDLYIVKQLDEQIQSIQAQLNEEVASGDTQWASTNALELTAPVAAA